LCVETLNCLSVKQRWFATPPILHQIYVVWGSTLACNLGELTSLPLIARWMGRGGACRLWNTGLQWALSYTNPSMSATDSFCPDFGVVFYKSFPYLLSCMRLQDCVKSDFSHIFCEFDLQTIFVYRAPCLLT